MMTQRAARGGDEFDSGTFLETRNGRNDHITETVRDQVRHNAGTLCTGVEWNNQL
jgi:hypothetical protein